MYLGLKYNILTVYCNFMLILFFTVKKYINNLIKKFTMRTYIRRLIGNESLFFIRQIELIVKKCFNPNSMYVHYSTYVDLT